MHIVRVFLLLILFSVQCFAQDDNTTTEEENEPTSEGLESMKGFHIGFFAGAFFPNKSSASLYDGYGLDANGNKNTFANSLMYHKIIVENSGQTTNQDNIAVALGVDHDQWQFDESDMSNDMKYNSAFLFGLASNYGLNKHEGLIFNFNFAKLTATGNFTIVIKKRLASGLQEDSVTYHGIKGEEQRMMFQLGYSRILTNSEKWNILLEGGLCVNNARYRKNTIYIKSLTLDLAPYDYITNYTSIVDYTGWGFGAFASLGFNVTMNPKYIIQFLYTPSFEKVNFNKFANSGLQQSAGVRVYYNF